MNYSHYLTLPAYKNELAFMHFIEDVRTIVENAPSGAELCGEEHMDEPLINMDVLIIGSKANARPFSTLHIDKTAPWPKHRYPLLSVRTDKLLYDSVICACLMAFHHHFPSSTITTDGTKEDWSNAIALYEYCTQRLAPMIDFQNT